MMEFLIIKKLDQVVVVCLYFVPYVDVPFRNGEQVEEGGGSEHSVHFGVHNLQRECSDQALFQPMNRRHFKIVDAKNGKTRTRVAHFR